MAILLVLIFSAIVAFMSALNNKDSFKEDILGALFLISLAASALWFLAVVEIRISSSVLTGYLYQRTETSGTAKYSIRFSQGAGEDKQPSFCVVANSDTDKKLIEKVGKDEKVKVVVPSAGIVVKDHPFKCASPATLEELR